MKKYQNFNKMNIQTVKHVKNYLLEIVYDNGEIKLIDLEKFLKSSDHPLIRKYLDVNLFSQVYLDETGSPCWGDNEFDINPKSLLKNEFD
jgi:hypothetical protein